MSYQSIFETRKIHSMSIHWCLTFLFCPCTGKFCLFQGDGAVQRNFCTWPLRKTGISCMIIFPPPFRFLMFHPLLTCNIRNCQRSISRFCSKFRDSLQFSFPTPFSPFIQVVIEHFVNTRALSMTHIHCLNKGDYSMKSP